MGLHFWTKKDENVAPDKILNISQQCKMWQEWLGWCIWSESYEVHELGKWNEVKNNQGETQRDLCNSIMIFSMHFIM